MKIAVFHQWLENIGGAEIVALELARGLGADLYTADINEENIKKMGFADVLPRIKSIGRVPVNQPFRSQMAFLKFRWLNLGKKYDLYIIAGDWAMSVAVNNKPNIWYVHSPLNELYEFKEYVKKKFMPFWQRPIYEIWVKFNVFLNKKYLKHVGKLVCNSRNTKRKIEKYYQKEAKIINPPINTKLFKNSPAKDYWLSVNRLSLPKRVEIQLESFKELSEEKLIIVGSYEKGSKHFEKYKNYLEKIRPANVQIVNWASDEDLKKLYAECKGFITTSLKEDFGMNVVEALASGKPSIAPNEGGYRESIIDGKTGILIDEIDKNKLTKAIRQLSNELEKNPDKYKTECINQVSKFDVNEFIRKIKEEINYK